MERTDPRSSTALLGLLGGHTQWSISCLEGNLNMFARSLSRPLPL